MAILVIGIAALLCVQHVHSQDLSVPRLPQIAGVPPTASGQIGVNPVTDLGPEKYQNIGLNTQWYQTEGSTTKWIGPNTEYLTDLPYTTTVNNQPTVTKAAAAIVAATATASSQGVEAGSVSVALSPKLIDIFNKLLGEAEAACGKNKRRATCNINERFAQRVAEEARPGGAFDFIGAESRALLPVITASDVAAIAGPALYASPLVGIAATWVLVNKLQAWVLRPDSISGGEGGGDDKGCPADAPKGDNAPSCDDNECKGDDKKCKQGKYKGCDCIVTGNIVDVYDTDETKYDDGKIWLDLQQTTLDDFIKDNDKAPYCYHGASPRGGRIPKEYCNCGDDNRKTLTYSVASSTASPYNPCPYTTNNGPTVTFRSESSPPPSATPVVACAPKQERSFKSSDGYNWINQFCTKNNERQLKLRLPERGMSDAVILTLNNNEDPYIRIYAYLDDACREKKTMPLNGGECLQALGAIMDQCDKDTKDKKMGGSVAISFGFLCAERSPSIFLSCTPRAWFVQFISPNSIPRIVEEIYSSGGYKETL
ncbi:hypothetical protein IQ06DRAFT_305952 [Phaeosphaeriaceae sp. SRC1lsM3a]|nr:hypothetical protein IQ06DRAFT_305952 [Stagonospora sp. SRC1lsM3a]